MADMADVSARYRSVRKCLISGKLLKPSCGSLPIGATTIIVDGYRLAASPPLKTHLRHSAGMIPIMSKEGGVNIRAAQTGLHVGRRHPRDISIFAANTTATEGMTPIVGRPHRRLEAECHRNIEVIWLLRTLKIRGDDQRITCCPRQGYGGEAISIGGAFHDGAQIFPNFPELQTAKIYNNQEPRRFSISDARCALFTVAENSGKKALP